MRCAKLNRLSLGNGVTSRRRLTWVVQSVGPLVRHHAVSGGRT